MEIQERQLRKRLKEDFEPHIVMTDVKNHQEDEQAKFRTSRALAALTVADRAKTTAEDSCASVVDESGDAGIDAIYVSQMRGEIYLVQAKTSAGSPSPTEVMKFANGIKRFLDCDWQALGPKARGRASEFEDALESSKVIAVFSHLGVQKPNDDAKAETDRLVAEVNANGEILEFSYEGLRENFERRNTALNLGAPDHEVEFERWVTMGDYRSEIMGIVAADQLAELVDTFSERLFDKNIRSILKATETNETLHETLSSEPSKFWYYNNGITIVAESISCGRINPRATDERFRLKGLSIVNGAQTSGALARAKRSGIALEDVRVTVRVISTAGHDADFGKQVTRKTNTQNQVTNREFVALDPYQLELSEILHAEGILYTFRSGQSLESEEHKFAFDLEEATRALACLSSIDNATRAKRELGRMWLDIKANPYLELFPRNLEPANMYNAVRFWRSFGMALDNFSKTLEKRGANIAKNSLYMACALFMQTARSKGVAFSNFEWDVEGWISDNTPDIERLVGLIVDTHEVENSSGHAMAFFKNQQKMALFSRRVGLEFRAVSAATLPSA
ncbi:AIPR family protein [Pseudarthrobacter sulfonivorans]|uniref:AIPR family protein n=1 Tax=Pseudarthrobacter sulfonivorans TaxID=121292 RepID=UPI002108373A|nr:AIPR family protein [Pseudarthrobacter sulfonivorans]